MRALLFATALTFLAAAGCFSFFWLITRFPEQMLFAICAGGLAIFWGVMYDHFG